MKKTKPTRPARVFSLLERRQPAQDPWTPESFLQDMLDNIRSGKVRPKSMALFYIVEEEESLRPHLEYQNMSDLEAVAFGVLLQHMGLDRWRES